MKSDTSKLKDPPFFVNGKAQWAGLVMDTFGSMTDQEKQDAKKMGFSLETTDSTCYTPKSLLKEFRYTPQFVEELNLGPGFKPTVISVYGLPVSSNCLNICNM